MSLGLYSKATRDFNVTKGLGDLVMMSYLEHNLTPKV